MSDKMSDSMKEEKEPIKLVGFLCNWCSYAGADLAGVSRFQYDASIRIVRIPCSGRADPQLALLALQQGADGVLVSGCHPGDCHYSDGNFFARRRFAVIHDLMDFLGLDPRLLQMSWVSASEGRKWADVVNSVAADVRAAKEEARDQKAAPVPEIELFSPPPIKEDPAATAELREIAREMLASGRVKAVLGHGKRPGNRAGATVVVATSPEAVDRLFAFTGCAANLARYLKPTIAKHGRTAIVGKGGDLLAAINLEREKQIEAGLVERIAVACPGAVTRAGTLAGHCAGCKNAALAATQIFVGGRPDTSAEDDFADVSLFEQLPRAARAAFWNAHFANCMRCYACRNACPSCFCNTCFADSRRPTWVFPSASAQSNLFFHLERAYHLAGRCADCGECARVCPMDVPLLLLARKAAKTVRDRFGLAPSADPAEKNALCRFKPDEQVEFIR